MVLYKRLDEIAPFLANKYKIFKDSKEKYFELWGDQNLEKLINGRFSKKKFYKTLIWIIYFVLQKALIVTISMEKYLYTNRQNGYKYSLFRFLDQNKKERQANFWYLEFSGIL